MPHYKPIPYPEPSSLLHVRTLLFGGTNAPAASHDQRAAIATIHAWSLRRSHLPQAVIATATLLDALLFDVDASHRTPQPSSNSLTQHSHDKQEIISPHANIAQLSMAFTTFVTLTCDAAQHPLYKQRMSTIAFSLGMPGRWIALRHEVVHEGSVSAKRLRQACSEGLDWLRASFWDRLGVLDESVEVVEKDMILENSRGLLGQFKKQRIRELQKMTPNGQGQAAAVPESVRETSTSLIVLLDYASCGQLVEAIANVLVRDSMLFPRGYKAGESMEGAFAIWEVLMRVISRAVAGFGEGLITRLVDVDDSEGVDAARVWLDRILTGEEWLGIDVGDREKWDAMREGEAT